MAFQSLRLGGRAASQLISRSPKFSAVNLGSTRRFSEMPLTFATPNSMFYGGTTVKQIDVPSLSGAFGILPNHVPTMAALSPGVVAVYESDGGINKYFVSSGTVTVNADSTVQLLAEEACPLADLDANAAREALAAANASVASAKDELEKAEALIAAEAAEAIVKAVSG